MADFYTLSVVIVVPFFVVVLSVVVSVFLTTFVAFVIDLVLTIVVVFVNRLVSVVFFRHQRLLRQGKTSATPSLRRLRAFTHLDKLHLAC